MEMSSSFSYCRRMSGKLQEKRLWIKMVSLVSHPSRNVDADNISSTVALRDDDAESSDDDGDERDARRREAVLEARERENARGTAKANPVEKQPTGKVVGIIKRNWRP